MMSVSLKAFCYRSFLFCSIVFAAINNASAGVLLLEFEGKAIDSTIFGSPIASGLGVKLDILFSDVPVDIPEVGLAVYAPTSGYVEFTSTGVRWDVDLTGYTVQFADDRYIASTYLPILDNGTSTGSLVPMFSGVSNPTWSATDPEPTEFTGFLSFISNRLTFPLIFGELSLKFDDTDFSARIQNVPEPSTLALAGLGGLGLAVRAIRRRRNMMV